jgi:hypothetical protein
MIVAYITTQFEYREFTARYHIQIYPIDPDRERERQNFPCVAKQRRKELGDQNLRMWSAVGRFSYTRIMRILAPAQRVQDDACLKPCSRRNRHHSCINCYFATKISNTSSDRKALRDSRFSRRWLWRLHFDTEVSTFRIHLLLPYSGYTCHSLALKTEAARLSEILIKTEESHFCSDNGGSSSFEIFVPIYQTTWRHIPEESNLPEPHWQNTLCRNFLNNSSIWRACPCKLLCVINVTLCSLRVSPGTGGGCTGRG